MEFSRHEYWSGLPFPSPRDLPESGTEPASPASTGGFFTAEPPAKPRSCIDVSAKIWKQTRCPSVGEGIKLRNSQTIQKYSALESDELPSNEDTYRNLKIHIIKYKKPN